MIDSHLFTGKLSNWLQAWSQGKLRNGRLDIKGPNQGQRWSLYFHLGHLIGDTGGVHPGRRWYRQLSQYCPQLGVNAVSPQEEMGKPRNYGYLADLLRKREILRQQMVAVVQGSIAEVLFDILHQEELLRDRRQAQLTYTYIPEDLLYSSPLVFIQPDQAWRQAQQAWASWQQAGLKGFSPNMAPVIWQKEQLQQQTSALAYRSLINLLDGKRSLRDLALDLKQEPLLLLESLIPYLRQGLIKFVEIADLGCAIERLTPIYSQPKSVVPPPQPPQPQPNAPLVAYIEDSARDSQIMGQIITKAGLRYINLQDSVLALPMLLEHKPNLIFLDLVMPIANGYEICAQIRRTSVLKDTPVIIFTGNDGIVDRVRAKLVRSTDFLAKPIETKKVMAVIQKYLSMPGPVKFERGHQNTPLWSSNQ